MISLLLAFSIPTSEVLQSRHWWVSAGRGPNQDGWQFYAQVLGVRVDVMWLPN